MNELTQCANCRFVFGQSTDASMECRRHSPMCQPHPNGLGLWPQVLPTDLCGDYEIQFPTQADQPKI